MHGATGAHARAASNTRRRYRRVCPELPRNLSLHTQRRVSTRTTCIHSRVHVRRHSSKSQPSLLPLTRYPAIPLCLPLHSLSFLLTTYTLPLSLSLTHTQLTGNAAFYINLKGSQSGNAEKEVIVCGDMWQQLSVAEAVEAHV